MELIYLDSNMVEQGIIKDFKLDLAYGKDENDFEIKTSENEMLQGYYWHLVGTNYGGVVDEIAKVSNEQEVTYRGRSLEGILASYSGYSLEDDNYIVVRNETLRISGKPSQIASAIISQLDIPIQLTEADENELEVSLEVDRSLDIYQILRSIEGYKVILGIDKGLTLTITGAIDYTSQEYFDATQFAINISAKSNIPNHLIGVYKTDEQTYVKHIYLDENGEVIPYYQLDSNHDTPMHDHEYERVEGGKVLSGLDERIAVIEGGSTIENMDMVTRLTDTDGNTPFTDNIPSDWNTNFQDYYLEEWQDGELRYNPIPQEPAYKPIVIPSATWWERNWGSYYKRVVEDGEEKFVQLTSSDINGKVGYFKAYNAGTLPPDWETSWVDYYKKISTDVYEKIDGIQQYKYQVETGKGERWDTDRGSFYIYWKRYKWAIDIQAKKNGKWVTVDKVTVKDSLKNGKPQNNNHTYAWWVNHHGKKSGQNTVFVVTTSAPNVSYQTRYVVHPKKKYDENYYSLEEYCNRMQRDLYGKNGIKWGEFKVYLKIETYKTAPLTYTDLYLPYTTSNVPDMSQTYYEPDGYRVPPFNEFVTYRKVQDHYSNLVAKMLDELAKIRATAVSINADFDTDIGEFDVGDIIGGTHPFTNEMIQSTINKKIIKADSDKIDISYEV